jgi:hypothetical protein
VPVSLAFEDVVVVCLLFFFLVLASVMTIASALAPECDMPNDGTPNRAALTADLAVDLDAAAHFLPLYTLADCRRDLANARRADAALAAGDFDGLMSARAAILVPNP